MSSAFLSSLIDTEFSQDYRVKVSDGQFTMVNRTMATVTEDGKDYHSALKLSADFQCAGMAKKVNRVQNFSDYSGMNRKFITEYGVFDTGTALAEFSRGGLEKRVVKEDTLSVLSKHTMVDSHEEFLYNMLVSWQLADMYVSNDGKDGTFKVRKSAYEDSHCKYDYNQSGEGIDLEIQLGDPVTPDMVEGAGWAYRDASNYWSKPFVLHYNAAEPKQEAFYLLHVAGRDIDLPLNFVLPLKGIRTSDLLLDPVNSSTSMPTLAAEIPWERPHLIWLWIMDYVTMNRLEQQFASALELLGAMTYQPKWSSLEACVWQESSLVANIAEFSPTRARIKGTLEGEPYVPSSVSHEFLIEETRAPQNFMMTSALLNYYMWYGYYTLLHNRMSTAENWRDYFGLSVAELVGLKSPMARAMCVSVLTGKEISTCMSHGCGMFIETSRMSKAKTIGPVVPKDNTTSEVTPIEYLPAPVSGSIILGTVVNEFDTTVHLAAMQHIDCRGTYNASYSIEESLVIANTFRLFGHEVEFESNRGEKVRPWAPVRECIIEPASIRFSKRRHEQLHVIRSREREGRSDELNNVRSLLMSKRVTLSVRTPTVSLNKFGKIEDPVCAFYVRPNSKKIKFSVKANFSFDPSAFTAAPIPKLGTKDFGAGGSEMVPTAPATHPGQEAEGASMEPPGEGAATAE